MGGEPFRIHAPNGEGTRSQSDNRMPGQPSRNLKGLRPPLLAERGDGRTVTPRGSASALPESFDGLGYSTL